MSVDITNWDENPAKNGEIEGMSLAKSAPMSNVAGMVSTLMAAIKTGDVETEGLAAQMTELEQAVAEIDATPILTEQIDSLFVN